MTCAVNCGNEDENEMFVEKRIYGITAELYQTIQEQKRFSQTVTLLTVGYPRDGVIFLIMKILVCVEEWISNEV